MEGKVIEVNQVSKIFNTNKNSLKNFLGFGDSPNSTIRALENVSFTAEKGEVIGIIGLNGSGKSTLLRIISGIYNPTSGSVRVNGIMAPLLQLGIGFHKELVASENIVMYGMLLGMNKDEIIDKIPQIIKFAELEKFSKLKLKHYSSGMQTRLAFSIALQIDPDILIIDEILAVGDIKFKEKSFEAFRSFKEKGKTILYATHNLRSLPDLCDRVLLMHKGKVLDFDNPNEAIKKYQQISKEKQKNNL